MCASFFGVLRQLHVPQQLPSHLASSRLCCRLTGSRASYVCSFSWLRSAWAVDSAVGCRLIWPGVGLGVLRGIVGAWRPSTAQPGFGPDPCFPILSGSFWPSSVIPFHVVSPSPTSPALSSTRPVFCSGSLFRHRQPQQPNGRRFEKIITRDRYSKTGLSSIV